MNANKIMIGDWVVRESHNNGPMQVIGITENGVTLKRENGLCGEAIDLIEPIPLTSEILEKNGLKYSDESHDYTLLNRIDDDNIWSMKAFKIKDHEHWCVDISFSHFYCSESAHIIIKHVHELQHALRLCRLSDFENNFKV